MRYIKSNGDFVPAGQCVVPDNYVTTFTVTVRSMHPISAENIKTLIQQRHEVTAVEKTAEVCVCR